MYALAHFPGGVRPPDLTRSMLRPTCWPTPLPRGMCRKRCQPRPVGLAALVQVEQAVLKHEVVGAQPAWDPSGIRAFVGRCSAALCSAEHVHVRACHRARHAASTCDGVRMVQPARGTTTPAGYVQSILIEDFLRVEDGSKHVLLCVPMHVSPHAPMCVHPPRPHTRVCLCV